MGIADDAVRQRPRRDPVVFWERLRAILLRPELTALVSTIAVFAFFAINAGDQGFLTFTGTRNYLQVAAEIGIIASPITLLLVAGEFDLSVGTMVGAAGIAVAYPIVHLGWPLWAALLSGFALACIVGCANGLLIVRLGIPSFLATLGMMFFLRGLTLAITLLLTGTTQIYQLKDSLRGDPLLPIFAGTIRGLPVSIFWWLGLVLLCAYLLSRTRFGNWIYASGGDRDAAIKMGVPVEGLKICLYVATAAAAVLVAVVNMLFADMAEVAQGVGKEFEAIVAAVVGGAATTGGLGSPIGTAIGTLMFGMISQGFFYTNINDNWFYSFVGAVLVLAVVANKYARDVAMRQGRRR
jgi:simple sugar transport system permease protein